MSPFRRDFFRMMKVASREAVTSRREFGRWVTVRSSYMSTIFTQRYTIHADKTFTLLYIFYVARFCYADCSFILPPLGKPIMPSGYRTTVVETMDQNPKERRQALKVLRSYAREHDNIVFEAPDWDAWDTLDRPGGGYRSIVVGRLGAAMEKKP